METLDEKTRVTDESFRVAFGISAAVHGILFLTALFLGQKLHQSPLLQLTEIDMVEPMEVQQVQEEMEVKQKVSALEFIKQVIPVKRRVKPRPAPPRPAPQPAAPAVPPKPRVIQPSGAPLISKKTVNQSDSVAAEPVISRSSLGRGPDVGAPQWEEGPGARMGGGGRQVNLGAATFLPETKKNVVDADIAASLQGRGGGLVINKHNDLRGVIEGVNREKQAALVGRGTGKGVALGGFKDAFSVFGEIRNRKILRMKMPRYPAWAEEQGIEAAVTVALGVYADGSIDESSVYVESTSGYTELDNLAMQAAKEFFFAPLAANKKQVVQYGSIRFVFRLKR